MKSVKNAVVRNCMIVPFYKNNHAATVSAPGNSWTNNLVWGAVLGTKHNSRSYPILSPGNSHWHRNLIVASVGSHYCRLICMWYGGGRFTENHIYGGKSWQTKGEDRLFVYCGDSWKYPKRIFYFQKNLVYGAKLGELYGGGMVFEDNTCYLRGAWSKSGFGQLKATKQLVIRNNTFHVGPQIDPERFYPTGENLPNLGGKWLGRSKFVPAPDGGTKPVIENNKIVREKQVDIRQWNHVDLARLWKLLKKAGNDSPVIRPKAPARNLRVEGAGKGQVRLTWDASADPEVVGYRIRYGREPNSFAHHQLVKEGTSATVKGLGAGTWYFTVAAHKPAFVECWTLSNEAALEVK